MLDILTSIIANGTTVSNWGYQPWLPFYNFSEIIILAIIATAFMVNKFWGGMAALKHSVISLSSSLAACVMSWLLWTFFEIGPDLVFINWLIWGCNLYLMNIMTFAVLEEWFIDADN